MPPIMPSDAPIELTSNERDRLRALADKLAGIAALPVQREKAELWRKLNQLEPVRPVVWIDEVPWHEMQSGGELDNLCSHPWARALETRMLRTLYQWRHFPADMVVSGYLACPAVINDTGFGIDEDVDIVRTDDASSVVSRHFHRQICEPEDIEKITMPTIVYDKAATQVHLATMTDLFREIMPVQLTGVKHIWYTPWDDLIRWWGVQEALMDLVMRPEMVHAAVDRMVANCMSRLDQLEALNLLTLNNDNTRIGSGGYGYTAELPGTEDVAPEQVRAEHMWGCSNAQIFSEVSPEMHWEFALKHDMPWLQRWGMTYYGCCEPLDFKMDLLRRIPNLRKISMSPWIDLDRAVREIQDQYVFSRKPNPAILAEDEWDPQRVRTGLEDFVARTRGCRCEIILKDISTVRYQPKRLWEWENIAMEMVQRCE